ncbi:CRM-domain containing factor CFM2, chloroplastic [Malania oleifera]|uniref:CRM-domain containing factor CFM2, chloroplastic n=1 Tax=Malania oleifera TaxID=397392 RepID=UPI0025AE7E9F|nr:CRM-domain containing factor CFM2, chloroplastic [Malania oleifera]
MPLPLCHHHHCSLPSPALPDSSSPFYLFLSYTQTLPKTLLFRNPKPPKFLLRCSTSDPKTLPKSAIQRIADKLRSLGYVDEDPGQIRSPESETQPETVGHGSAGEIFVPFRRQLPKHRVGCTLDSSWSTPENPMPEPASGSAIARFYELTNEVKKQEKELAKKDEEKVPILAERTLPRKELKRLQRIGIGMKKKLKIGKAGITEGIVNGIHERWRRSEVVKVACEDLCKINMKRTHDLLERKTGGLVVWRSGSKIVLYRGPNYEYPYFSYDNIATNHKSSCLEDGVQDSKEGYLPGMDSVECTGPRPIDKMSRASLIQGVGCPNRVRFLLPGEAQLAEEADQLLDGLGPRFTDWWGPDPLPVDADLLPEVVPGYRRRFRLLPYGVKPTLTNDEMNTLRRLVRPLPCHFALGRNRRLQGLAASIVKLWEKCEIAKIAVKRGVQNTNNEMMADELKRLTGGTLLSRDREFIVFYRGKDFLPPAVSSAIEERRRFGVGREKQRVDCGSSVLTEQVPKLGTIEHASGDELDGTNGQKQALIPEQRKLRSTEAAIKRTSIKLSRALEKRAKAEKLLSELGKGEVPQQPEIDKEGITEEERYMLRRVGLKIKPFLLLGRRGVFDGTVENMHLHWKYRELVKILCSDRSIEEVHAVARTLEAESRGILVAVERVRKGYAIIIYRGKNYERPACLRPQTLLNKREAMKRSLEVQRRQSLKLHVLKLNRNIDGLNRQLVKEEEMNRMLSAEESKLHLVKEEMNDVQSLDCERLDSELKADSHCCSLLPAGVKDNVEDKEKHGFVNADDGMDDSRDNLEKTLQEKPVEIFSKEKDETDEPAETEVESLSVSASEETPPNSLMYMDVEGDVYSTSLHKDFKSQGSTNCSASENAERHVFCDKKIKPAVVLENDLKPLTCGGVDGGSNGTPFKAAPLSNRDRLLLRKQALKMRKQPLLAIGKNNMVSGLARAIKAHFQRHPLAIVNVKGRTKGTSVQEVVFKLEQATGAVLVSQEPSKVILYRGWGAGGEPGHAGKKNTRYASEQSVGEAVEARPAVSPELMAAIRSECGLWDE